jgi:uncharacterized protein YozE (UPF0346 family)
MKIDTVGDENMTGFYAWLLKQSERGDMISDFASDVKDDSSFPKNSTNINTLREHLVSKGACKGAIEALNESWEEFSHR